VCNSICEQAASEGSPRTQAERIALACKSYCASESTPTAVCAADCLIRESRRSATQR
jgi:hypothetical protein